MSGQKGSSGSGKQGSLSGTKRSELYCFLYIAGIQSVRLLKRFKRKCARFFEPVTVLFRRLYKRLIGRRVEAAREEAQRVRHGFEIASQRLQDARKIGVFRAAGEFFIVTGKSIVRHRGIFFKFINIAAPVAAIAVLFVTLSYWNNLNYGLQLAYDGKDIATIQNEKVFEKATDMVNQRLVYDAGNSKSLGITPTFKLAVVDNTRYATPSSVCDKIIEQSNGIIEEACGLYVDGNLIGSVKSSADLSFILQNILNSAKSGDANAEAAFSQDVETVTGLFPTDSILSAQTMKGKLSAGPVQDAFYTVKKGDTPSEIAVKYNMSLGTLETLNSNNVEGLMFEGKQVKVQSAKPFLSVKIVKQVTYQKTLDYKTVTTQDSSKYTDYSVVSVKGQEGQQQLVDKVTYVDGVEIARENVSTTVLQDAVDKQVVVGTKKRPTYSGSGQSSGSLMWPVPSVHNITSTFAWRWGSMHWGIDIAGHGGGQTIVAADGGTVEYVVASGWGDGYGHHLQINHGNGIETLYAHCSTILVQPGQKVSKGQPIAYIGNTGDSSGYHCHFEVHVNGSKINPLNYVRQ